MEMTRKKTENDLIFIGSPIPFDTDAFQNDLVSLMDAAYANKENIREMVQKIVLTYHPVDNTQKNEELLNNQSQTGKVGMPIPSDV